MMRERSPLLPMSYPFHSTDHKLLELMKTLNGNSLFEAALFQARPILEFEFGGQKLLVHKPNVLTQRFKMLVSKSQGQLQAYYAPVLKLQEEEGEEAAAQLAYSVLSSDNEMYESGKLYIEAVCEIEPGTLTNLIEEQLKQIEGDRKKAGQPPLSEREREYIGPLFVSQATRMIREAIAEAEAEGQKAIEQGKQEKAVVLLEPEKQNSNGLKLTAAKS